MDTKILAFAGKLGSGKTSCANFIHAIAFCQMIVDKDNNLLTPRAYVNDNGKLMIGLSETEDGELNLDSQQPEVVNWLAQNVWPFIKKFSHATPLKEFCVNVLGLNPAHVYGSQEDKNNLTHLKWEDMPTKTKKTGFMTVREVMEYFGTEIVRKMYSRAWAKASIKSILSFGSLVGVNDDTRFIDEVEEIQAVGGKVIRLTLVTEESAKNTHRSNVELDNYDKFDAVIDNQNMTMQEAFAELRTILVGWEWMPE